MRWNFTSILANYCKIPRSKLPILIKVVFPHYRHIKWRYLSGSTIPNVSLASCFINYHVWLGSNLRIILKKSLNKLSSFFAKMKKFRGCENRFKIAFSNRQTQVTYEWGGISPLSWLIMSKFHNQNYRYWLKSYFFIIVISNDDITAEVRYLTSPSQAATKITRFD